jgi:hypothetical protein
VRSATIEYDRTVYRVLLVRLQKGECVGMVTMFIAERQPANKVFPLLCAQPISFEATLLYGGWDKVDIQSLFTRCARRSLTDTT